MATKTHSDIFVKSLVVDKLKVKPYQLNMNIKELLHENLQKSYEGKCSHHGYIKPYSIKIHNYSLGSVFDASLNGDLQFYIQYYADICNPSIGSIISGFVTKINSKGILVESFTEIPEKNKKLSILKTCISKEDNKSDVNLEDIKLNDMVYVEIEGKKFELNDKNIYAYGKIVKSPKNKDMILENLEVVENDSIDINSEDYISEEEKEEKEEESEDVDIDKDDDKEEKENHHKTDKKTLAVLSKSKNIDDDEDDIDDEDIDEDIEDNADIEDDGDDNEDEID